jgi:hypothetical protein
MAQVRYVASEQFSGNGHPGVLARLWEVRGGLNGLHADPGERPAGHGAGDDVDGDFDDDDTEGKGMSDKKYPTRMHEVLDEMPDNYPASHLDKADYALFCLRKSLKSISPALGRISRLCGLLRLGEKDGKNTTPRIITHDGSRMALKHLTMVKRDVDDAYQEILRIFESTKEPGAVSETESVGQGPEPGTILDASDTK